MWIRRMHPYTANGSASGCRQRRSGRRRRGGQMAASIRGVTKLRRRFMRTLGNRIGPITRYWRRWARSKRARVPMASMTWPGMSGNGSVICTTITIIRSARRRIRQGRRRVGPGRSVAVLGTAILGRCALRIGASYRRRTRDSTGSAVRRTNRRRLFSLHNDAAR